MCMACDTSTYTTTSGGSNKMRERYFFLSGRQWHHWLTHAGIDKSAQTEASAPQPHEGSMAQAVTLRFLQIGKALGEAPAQATGVT